MIKRRSEAPQLNCTCAFVPFCGEILLTERWLGIDTVLGWILCDDSDGEKANHELVSLVSDRVFITKKPDGTCLGCINCRSASTNFDKLRSEWVWCSCLTTDRWVERIWIGGD